MVAVRERLSNRMKESGRGKKDGIKSVWTTWSLTRSERSIVIFSFVRLNSDKSPRRQHRLQPWAQPVHLRRSRRVSHARH